MTALCLALALVISPAPPPDWHEGFAVKYSAGVMENVARNRGIPPADCMIAYTYAQDSDMGVRWLEVEGIKSKVRRRCLVVDLPRKRDKWNLIRRGILIELDAESGQAICGAAWSGKATECPVRVRVALAVVGQRQLKIRERMRWVN